MSEPQTSRATPSRIRRVRAVLLLSLLLTGRGFAREVEIVRDGRALAVLVVPADAHPLEKEAAADLRWAVKEATGVSLEMLAARPPSDARAIIRVDSGKIWQERMGDLKAASSRVDLPYDAAYIHA